MKFKRIAKHFLLFFNLILIGSLIYGFNSKLYSISNSKFSIPEFSAGEISIITPKNKTYFKPMSGYYPATYGFENDAIGGDALDWDDSASDSNCGSQVIAEKNGHYNVIEIYDNNGGSKARLNNHFVDQSYGTVELWFCPGDATNGGVVRLMDMDVVENRAYLRLLNDHWYSYDGSVDTLIPNVPDPQDNVWQHIKIHFESTSGGYHGLAQYTYEVIINGVSSGSIPFYTNGGSIDTFNIFTGNTATTTRWIDAVGYSWDPKYNIGDNLEEGLLLSFDTSFISDWLGYSLNRGNIKTIFGDTTIPFPNNGIHNIQVFGNNSLGTEYFSAFRYFSVNTSYEPPKPTGIPMVMIILIIVGASIGIAIISVLAYTLHKRSKLSEEPPPKQTKTKKKKEEIKPLILSCPFCQAELPGDQKFCYYCGAKLED